LRVENGDAQAMYLLIAKETEILESLVSINIHLYRRTSGKAVEGEKRHTIIDGLQLSRNQ
jgi:hypothetical protein